MDRLARTRWRIQTLAVLLLWWHSAAVIAAYSTGHREGFRRNRYQSVREATQRSRERAYSLGYRHGKKDARALKVVANNPPPADLYRGKHEKAG